MRLTLVLEEVGKGPQGCIIVSSLFHLSAARIQRLYT